MMAEQNRSLLCRGVNSVALNLFEREITFTHGIPYWKRNLVMSPFTVHTLLGILGIGASGQTKEEILTSLNLNHLINDEIARSFGSLFAALKKNDQLYIFNRLYCRCDFPIRPVFQEMLTTQFCAEFPRQDFLTEWGKIKAAVEISDEIEDLTNQKIKYQIHPDLMENCKNPACLVPVNTMYFEARWKYPFNPKLTFKGRFYNAGGEGNCVMVEKMYLNKRLPYCHLPELNIEIVALPFQNGKTQGDFSFIIIRPTQENLTKDNFGSIIGKKFTRHLKVSHVVVLLLPKFRIQAGIPELDEVFSTMEVRTLFDSIAEFKDLSDTDQEIFASPYRLNHKTFIEICEGSSNWDEYICGFKYDRQFRADYSDVIIPFDINQPFFFQIVDHTNDDMVLFCGQCNHLFSSYGKQMKTSKRKLDESSGIIASSAAHAILFSW